MIADRPAEVDDRAVPGHWRGDLITGELNKTAIGTPGRTHHRYTMLAHHLPGSHDAETVRDADRATMTTLPAHLRGSPTLDPGRRDGRTRGLRWPPTCRCISATRPAPWRRGANENTNGLYYASTFLKAPT